jgi:tetratricopeptide (TPR) repeat protein
MILFSALVILKAKQNKTGFFIGFIVVIVLFLTGTSGWDAIFKRFENLRDASGLIYDDRLIIWQDCRHIFLDFPLVGTGAGTLEKIYPLYRTFPGNDLLEHAHNDYLEFFCTGGIILPTLMGWCLFSILYSAAGSFMKRREWYSLLLFTGCVTAISAILLHSVVDFNMQIGANGLYFFLVLALAVSSANTRIRSEMAATYLNQSKFSPFITGIAVFFFLITITYAHEGALIANHYVAPYRNIALRSDMPENKLLSINQAAKTAAAFDMLNPRYAHIIANTASLQSNNSEALKHYVRSVRLDPKNSLYLMDAASFIHRHGNPDQAEALFRTSIQCDKTNMAAYIKYAAMLFEMNQAEKSFSIMKEAISVDARITDTCLALMVLHQIEDDRMHLALPDRVEPHLILGDFFDSSGEKPKAESAYLKALEFLSNETQTEKNYFLHIYQFYHRNHMDEKALNVILKAILFFPDDPGLRRTAGDLYKNLGIDYRAEEEYRRAEMLKSVLPVLP